MTNKKRLAVFCALALCLMITPHLKSQNTSPSDSESSLENQAQQAQEHLSNFSPSQTTAKPGVKPLAAPVQNPPDIGALIEKLEHDPDYYAADASAEIHKGHAEEAYDKAYSLALERLAKRIQVTITSQSQSRYSYNASGSSHVEKEQIEDAIDLRTHLVLADPENSLYLAIKKFLDYPQKGFVDVLLSVPQKKYHEIAEKQLSLKKERVEGLAEEGEKELASKRVMSGLRDLILAQNTLSGYWGESPVEMRMDKRKQEMQSFLAGKISGILENISLAAHPNRITYSAEGKINQSPQIEASYKDARGGIHVPIKGLSLKSDFSEGRGTLARHALMTDSRGLAQIPIVRIDPSQSRATLQVEVDGAALFKTGSIPRFFSAPQCTVDLIKARSVAFAALAPDENLREKLATSIKRVLVSQGFSGMEIPGRAMNLKSRIQKAVDLHADYLLLVSIQDSSQKVGDYDLYQGWAQSALSLYALPNGEPVFDSDGPAAKSSAMRSHQAKTKSTSRVLFRISKFLTEKLRGVK
jgi:hypothetical protein